MADIDEEELKQYLNITLDIMGKIATEINPLVKEIEQMHADNYFSRLTEIQQVMRSLQIKYEPELLEKYNLSFMEYNQNMMSYRAYIERYIKDKPEFKEKYNSIKQQITFK
jgi:hypothetical protein